ncbi:MAG: hypothetical protein IPL26_19555 [Leptospiraceae bacterium]|nr:hypothetical protein [Leptospiraceae bacterium]
MLSIVVSTYEREDDFWVQRTLLEIKVFWDVEVIFVSKLEAKAIAERLNI